MLSSDRQTHRYGFLLRMWPPLTYSCPCPHLSAAEKRQILAASLLEHAHLYYAVTDLKALGTVRQYTRILQHGDVTILDGWVPVADAPCLPFHEQDLADPDQRQFLLTIPAVSYVVEVEVRDGRKCGYASYISGRRLTEKPTHIVHGLISAPLQSLRWRNCDYEPTMSMYTVHRPPSLTKLTNGDITRYSGLVMRDLLMVSVLTDHFRCEAMGGNKYRFSTPSGLLTQLTFYGDNVCVARVWDPVWFWLRGEKKAILRTLPELMDWAEKTK